MKYSAGVAVSGLDLQAAKSLAKEYYLTFYLDVSLWRLGLWGVLGVTAGLVFFTFLCAATVHHFSGNLEIAIVFFALTIIFEMIMLFSFSNEGKEQLEQNMRNSRVIPLLAAYQPSMLNAYKISWIKSRVGVDEHKFLNLCIELERAWLNNERFRAAAGGPSAAWAGTFFSMPKDRLVAWSLAFLSLLVAIVGGGALGLEGFFGFYGELVNFLTLSLTVFLVFFALVLLVIMFFPITHLLVNCVFESMFRKRAGCSRLTFYIFLRDCSKLAKILV